MLSKNEDKNMIVFGKFSSVLEGLMHCVVQSDSLNNLFEKEKISLKIIPFSIRLNCYSKLSVRLSLRWLTTRAWLEWRVNAKIVTNISQILVIYFYIVVIPL